MMLPAPEKRRYLLGAILCAVLNNTILVAGDAAGFGYVGPTILCFFGTGAFGYVFHSLYTFRQSMFLSGYLIFLAGQIAGLLATFAGLHLLYRMLGLPMWIAAPVVTVMMLAFNYSTARLATRPRSRG